MKQAVALHIPWSCLSRRRHSKDCQAGRRQPLGIKSTNWHQSTDSQCVGLVPTLRLHPVRMLPWGHGPRGRGRATGAASMVKADTVEGNLTGHPSTPRELQAFASCCGPAGKAGSSCLGLHCRP